LTLSAGIALIGWIVNAIVVPGTASGGPSDATNPQQRD
jgi:hypothetical protein